MEDLLGLTSRLIHVATCKKADQCMHNPFCDNFKKLYRLHIRLCKDAACLVTYCKNSRLIIEHNRTCKDVMCRSCLVMKEGKSKLLKEVEEKRIKDDQERVLQLFHASKCQYKKGSCLKSPFCDDLKNLWIHVKSCKAYNCKILQCDNSRRILSHFRDCKACPTCTPVKEAMSNDAANVLLMLRGKNTGGFEWL